MCVCCSYFCSCIFRPTPAILDTAVAVSAGDSGRCQTIMSESLRCSRSRARAGGSRVSNLAAALVCRQPACTNAENALVPVCAPEAKQSLGEWQSANILTDHIAMDIGFSKHAYQAQCVTCEEQKFVHVRKNEPWFVAAVGGPSCKRCCLPSVCVLDLLQDELSDKFDKEGGDDADRGRGENGENEDGATDDLP